MKVHSIRLTCQVEGFFLLLFQLYIKVLGHFPTSPMTLDRVRIVKNPLETFTACAGIFPRWIYAQRVQPCIPKPRVSSTPTHLSLILWSQTWRWQDKHSLLDQWGFKSIVALGSQEQIFFVLTYLTRGIQLGKKSYLPGANKIFVFVL